MANGQDAAERLVKALDDKDEVKREKDDLESKMRTVDEHIKTAEAELRETVGANIRTKVFNYGGKAIIVRYGDGVDNSKVEVVDVERSGE